MSPVAAKACPSSDCALLPLEAIAPTAAASGTPRRHVLQGDRRSKRARPVNDTSTMRDAPWRTKVTANRAASEAAHAGRPR